MKVAVLLHWNEGETSGVFKKVVSQIRAWECQGIIVSLHIISRNSHLGVWQQHLGKTPITFHVYRGLASRLKAWRDAVKAAKAQQPDVVYHRYDIYMPYLEVLSRNTSLVLEINTDDLIEYCLQGGLRCWYNRLTRGLLLKQASGLVFVTHELANSPHFTQYGRPCTVVSNGIALEDYRTLPPPQNGEPRLVFLGSAGQPWHGLDKVIRMAQYFPKWRFDVIGIGVEEIPKPLPNVSVHGPLERQGYEIILAQSDVALGTLALHRKGVNEACPLKVREYLAFGLPVIIGYKDTDFPNGAPCILELPNIEDNVDTNLRAIEDFVRRWMGKRVVRDDIAHLDIGVKEACRLEFMQKVVR